ncbi:MAG: response regulator [Gammaproteobacteria bacterium]|jgi:CheY-like chemotaxis protein|nr:response regulator [Gammaproteobacteria bacterium]
MTEPNVSILYVEDEDDIRAVAQIALDGEGFELLPCASGQEALDRASDTAPDVILLDVMMPGMDGPTTLSQLRKIPHLANTPAIFMTAKVQPAEIAQLKSLGALDVIAKPFDPMGLADQLRAILDAA